MVKGLLDSTSTSNDFYTLFDNLVATNPQLEKTITEVRNESNIFLCKILKFYPYRDMAYVQLLDDNSKHYCHLTHEMLSYEVSFNCMCDGSVKTDDIYGSYVKPYNTIYGVVANVRFRGSTDEKCLLSCLNYNDNNDLKSSVRNGEIKLVVGDSTLSLTRSRINLMTPKLLVNGLPFNEPHLNNYYDKTEINVIKSDTDAQINELNDKVKSLDIDELVSAINEVKRDLEDLDLSSYMKKSDYTNDLNTASELNGISEFRSALDNVIQAMTGRGDNF